MLSRQKRLEDPAARITPAEAARFAAADRADQLEWGYPPEALTEEMLRWAYILNRRREYQRLQDLGPQANVVEMKILFNQLLANLTRQP
jgi:hypothetical protein